ncbi:MAG: hypothetical protein KF693_05450 [Nitrospira sp.]|nr:hypothetical protein [Nitrospira sp.]
MGVTFGLRLTWLLWWPQGKAGDSHFYQWLCQAGKAKTLALSVCLRKPLVILDAMAKDGTPWESGHESA